MSELPYTIEYQGEAPLALIGTFKEMLDPGFPLGGGGNEDWFIELHCMTPDGGNDYTVTGHLIAADTRGVTVEPAVWDDDKHEVVLTGEPAREVDYDDVVKLVVP